MAGSNLVHYGFRIENDLLDSLQKEADRKGVPLSNLVRDILRRGLDTIQLETVKESVAKDTAYKVSNAIESRFAQLEKQMEVLLSTVAYSDEKMNNIEGFILDSGILSGNAINTLSTGKDIERRLYALENQVKSNTRALKEGV